MQDGVGKNGLSDFLLPIVQILGYLIIESNEACVWMANSRCFGKFDQCEGDFVFVALLSFSPSAY